MLNANFLEYSNKQLLVVHTLAFYCISPAMVMYCISGANLGVELVCIYAKKVMKPDFYKKSHLADL